MLTPAFSPTEIPTCTLWLDASDATSVIGTGVATWKDKSGNGNNATGVNAPVFLKSTGGVSFTAASAQYFTMSVPYSKTNTMFMVASPVPSTTSNMYYVAAYSGGYVGTMFLGGYNNGYAVYYMAENTPGFANFSTTLPTSPFLASAVKTSGVSYTGYYNGAQVFTGADGTSDTAAYWQYIGAAAPGNNYLTATIYEVIIYNVALTANQIQAVNAYLGAKWGVAEAGQGSVAPVVNPLAISGCQLWLDGADATTIVPVVSQWNDKSGNGYNLAVGSGTTTYLNYGPGPSIRLNSSYLYINKVVNLTQYTFFIVVLSQTVVNNQSVFTGRPNTSTSYGSLDGFGFYVDSTVPDIRFYFANNQITNNTASTTISQPLVLASYTCTSAGVTNSWVNGVAGTSNTTGGLTRTSTAQGFALGGEWQGSSYGNIIDVANTYEIIVYNSVLTTTQRLQVENYLLAKWGTGRNFWIDASDATTVTKGTNVLTWTDKSGNGNNATAVGKPVLTANAINGIQAMYLADAPYFLGSVSITTTTLTCFAVATTNLTMPNGRARDQRLVSLENLTNVDYGRTDGTIALFNQNTTSTIATYRVSGPLANNAITTGTPFLAVSQYTGANAYLWYNGTAGTSTGGASSGSFGITKYGIGNQANPTTETWNGYIGEVIIYNTALTDTQRQQIQTYLGNKWGLTVSNQTAGIINPTLIPGCVLWLDAADSTSIVTSVSQMTDKSGNGYTITQSTATYQPALTNNYLTLGTSLNSYMNMPQAAINNTTSWTLFLVFNPSSSTNWIMVKQYDGNNTYNALSMTNYTSSGGGNTTGTTGVLYFHAYNAGTLFTGPSALTTSTNQLLTLICNGTNVYYYINGVLAAITNGSFAIQSQTGATNFTLGAWISSGSLVNSGVTNFQLGEMSFYNSALTTIQTQKIAASLMNKWSITNTLETATGSLADTPFFPTDITGCYFWLDGADTSSMTMTGTSITQWNDKSGSGYNATVASGKTAATFSTALNCVYFPASTTGYVTSCPANPTTETMFVVFNNASPSSGNNIIIGGQRGARSFGAGYSAAGTGYSGILNNEVEWYARQGVYASGTTAVYTGISQNTGTNTQLSQNGGAFSSYTATGTPNTYIAGTTTYLGVDTTTTNYYYIGYAMEIIFYNSVLSTAQIAQVNKYLKNKWNIAPTLTTLPTPVYNRPFQPVDITGLAMWFDAADNSTITLSGSLVTQWNDKSGNGYNATNSTYVSPTYSATGFNSRYPGLLFNGTSTLLVTAAILPTPVLSANGTDTTIFLVFNRLTGTGNYEPFGLGTNYNTYVLRDPWATGNSILDIGSSGRVSITNTVNGPQIYSLWRNGTADYMYNYGASIGSNLSASGTVGTTSQSFNIGGGIADGGYFNSYISELIIYNYTLSNSQRQQVEAYLAWKWGLISSLTSGHPGRTLPSFSTIFTPKSISSLTLWLDGADPAGTGITPANASSITTWADKSGLGYNATGGVSPTFATNSLNGLGTITFNGTSQYLYASTFTVPTATHFMIAVHKPNSIGTAGTSGCDTGILRAQSSGASGGFIVFPYASYGYYSSFNGSVILNNYDTAGAWNIYGVNVASGNTVQYQNGSLSSSTSASVTATTSDAFTIGAFSAYGATPSQYYSGSMAEIIVCSNTVTTFQRQQIEGYLAWKWGVQSLLPTTHAFKKFSP